MHDLGRPGGGQGQPVCHRVQAGVAETVSHGTSHLDRVRTGSQSADNSATVSSHDSVPTWRGQPFQGELDHWFWIRWVPSIHALLVFLAETLDVDLLESDTEWQRIRALPQVVIYKHSLSRSSTACVRRRFWSL